MVRRLKQYFEQAKTCTPYGRKMGLEAETLFNDRLTRSPISRETSQRVLQTMAAQPLTKAMATRGGFLVEVAVGGISIDRDWTVYDGRLVYELGWNNIELITEPGLIAHRRSLDRDLAPLDTLSQLMGQLGAEPVLAPWDGHTCNTLMLPDERDMIWLELDGPALMLLGHIAAVDLNIDLCSIEEGFEFIRALKQLREEKGWPAESSKAIWGQYLRGSQAGYETDRYGPSPTNFSDYCDMLAGMNVVMDRRGDELFMPNPVRTFADTPDVDIDLFLRSVWLWDRLRVRDDNLVLEIRGIRRTTNSQIVRDVIDILDCLGIPHRLSC